jgi:hypothetical protein
MKMKYDDDHDEEGIDFDDCRLPDNEDEEEQWAAMCSFPDEDGDNPAGPRYRGDRQHLRDGDDEIPEGHVFQDDYPDDDEEDDDMVDKRRYPVQCGLRVHAPTRLANTITPPPATTSSRKRSASVSICTSSGVATPNLSIIGNRLRTVCAAYS